MIAGLEGFIGERFGEFGIWWQSLAAGTRRVADSSHGYAFAISFGRRTRLYAAAVSVKFHPTRSCPRCRVLRRFPLVLAQPKTSSIRFLIRIETA